MKRGMDQRLKRSFTASCLPVRSSAASRMAGLALSVLVLMSQHAGAQAQAKLPVATVVTLQEAAQAYHTGQYQRALKLYEQLARGGDAEAAQRAGFMLLQANGHYGLQVRRDADRARALITQAARADQVAAGFMLNMLENTD